MSLLLRFALARPLKVLDELLAEDPGPFAVVGPAALALHLGQRRPVVALTPRLTARHGRRLGGLGVRANPGATPIADRSLSVLLGCDVAGADEATVLDWARTLREGGSLLLWSRHTRQSRQDHTRLALSARLVDVEQRVAGRIVVTRGRIKSFA